MPLSHIELSGVFYVLSFKRLLICIFLIWDIIDSADLAASHLPLPLTKVTQSLCIVNGRQECIKQPSLYVWDVVWLSLDWTEDSGKLILVLPWAW